MNLDEPFQKDKDGLYFIDSKDVSVKLFHFMEIKKSYSPKRDFYFIDNVPNYIIKDTTDLPRHFNAYRTKKILRNFMDKQDLIKEVDFPVGYFLDNDKIKGTIVPYYENSISVKQLVSIFKFEKLKEYYLHDDNGTINLIKLCLDILNLIKIMYDKDIVYLDINPANFLVYNNTVKAIDFEPGRVYFTKHKQKYLEQLLKNYTILVYEIWRHYNFENVIYNPGKDFSDAQEKVKTLYLEKRG